jgi:hypothetical protein
MIFYERAGLMDMLIECFDFGKPIPDYKRSRRDYKGLGMSFWLILFASNRLGSYPLLGKLIHDSDVRRSQREAESMYFDE